MNQIKFQSGKKSSFFWNVILMKIPQVGIFCDPEKLLFPRFKIASESGFLFLSPESYHHNEFYSHEAKFEFYSIIQH